MYRDPEHWTSKLPSDTYNRLCACHNTRKDLPILVACKWADMIEKGKQEEGFTKEDALVEILDLLDCNGQYTDLTRAEYDALKA